MTEVSRVVNGVAIDQRRTDGFINGTAMCRAHEKEISDWLVLETTFKLVAALAVRLGTKVKTENSRFSARTRVSTLYPSIVIVKKGSPDNGGGTWIHPKLAVHLGQWCSAEFALLVSDWVEEWLTIGQSRVGHVAYWYERMRIALSDWDRPLQNGYFCVYREMMDFFCELENRFNYVIPDFDQKTGKRLVPDGSIGQRFNAFLRSEDEMPTIARRRFLGSGEAVDFRQPGCRKNGWFSGGKDYKEILMYNHVYPKSSHGNFQVHPAMSYPDKYRGLFRYYLQEYWIPDSCIPYLRKRDPKGLHRIQSRVMQMSSSEHAAVRGTLVGSLMPSFPESA